MSSSIEGLSCMVVMIGWVGSNKYTTSYSSYYCTKLKIRPSQSNHVVIDILILLQLNDSNRVVLYSI